MADNTKFGSSMQQMFEGMDKAIGTKSVMGEAMDLGGGKIAERLRDITIETLTPIEALNILFELKKMSEDMG